MSELIQNNDNRATIRWKLLTGVSALALTAYVSSTGVAKADDTDRPTLWIELGGQMELIQGLNAPFTAPFMSVPPTRNFYKPSFFFDNQKPARFAFGGDGRISFQPSDSPWIFSASIRYGRSHTKRHKHYQTVGPTVPEGGWFSPYPFQLTIAQPFADASGANSEHHMVLDFGVGRDVGIGLFGRDGTSSINAGVRAVSFTEGATTTIYARPNEGAKDIGKYGIFHNQHPTFTQYTLTGSAERSFHGVGPSLSWDASAALAGNVEDGELLLDWGINAAALFGRQKAKTEHGTKAQHYYFTNARFYSQLVTYPTRYNHTPPASIRSRKVAVSNIGGFAGLSVKYPNFKFSLGYRYDTFLNAMDTGIDVAKNSNLTFNGPYASISIGLGN